MGEEMNILRSEELEKVTGGASGKDWAHDKSALKQHTVVGLAPEKSCICMKKPEKNGCLQSIATGTVS